MSKLLSLEWFEITAYIKYQLYESSFHQKTTLFSSLPGCEVPLCVPLNHSIQDAFIFQKDPKMR